MPFTASHAAAVLPLARRGLPPSALVIGSMVPDLPYYLPTPTDGAATHSLAGVAGADLLYGLALFAVWHALLAPFALAIAPAALRDRLPLHDRHPRRDRHPFRDRHPRRDRHPFRDRRPRRDRLPRPAPRRTHPALRAARVAVALMLGAATHVVWDSFTHTGRWGPAHIPWLARTHAGLPGYRWAQYASGLLGAAAIAVWLVRWWRTTPPAAERRPAAGRPVTLASWTLIALATTAGAAAAALPALREPDPRGAAFLAVTRGGGAGLAAAVVCAALAPPITRRLNPRRAHEAPDEP
ncbi:DUF4184 family protein [Phytohabitans suffuscus]|uniref:DUF4184 domain-containing protein n=1 Tax=Phytohabitans suffuscus TaxID=624315 RepID=A0A6F8YXA7_9ACTN|nr:DUF4184 family protein [Phytohabitans suffuscus]BCB90800.1 hypothetical protein Psuf_081130 [Phytohabitans suffuscus]